MPDQRLALVLMTLSLSGPLAGCAPRQAPSMSDAAAATPTAGASDAGTTPAPPPDMTGVTWEWVGFSTPVEQVAVDTPDRYTLRFEPDRRVLVRADCNRGSAAYSIGEDRRMALEPFVLTKMACPPGSLSDRFVKEVGRAASYFLKEGDLYLELPVDSGTLRFRRAG